MTADKAMASNVQDGVGPLPNPWRRVVWGTAAFLLLLPLFAMQFTEEVNWDAVDFIAFGAMLLAACGAYELTTKLSGNSKLPRRLRPCGRGIICPRLGKPCGRHHREREQRGQNAGRQVASAS